MSAEPDGLAASGAGNGEIEQEAAALRAEIESLQRRVELAEERRRALVHIMGDLNESNQKLADQRKAMIHIIGLYVGNAIDQIRLGGVETSLIVDDLEKAMEQVRKATDIISHLRTFGRAARVNVELVDVDDVIERSLLLVQEQFRLRGIEVELELCPDELLVLANAIQLEQVFINLLTNARDALEDSKRKKIKIASDRDEERITIAFSDTGPGIPRELQQRIFDPFFTTKEVGTGTGLGLSITYSILKEYGGEIPVSNRRGGGATFLIELPRAETEPPEEVLL